MKNGQSRTGVVTRLDSTSIALHGEHGVSLIPVSQV
jgi:hypothetical protein